MTKSGRIRTGLRKLLRASGWLALAAVVIAGAVLLYLGFGGAVYRRVAVFPAEARAWEELRGRRAEVTLDDGWNRYRGVLHNHSELSHDSEVTFPEILAAAKEADVQFVFMSDHCTDSLADYSRQWSGLHDGVLFVPGFEMAHGFMPWGLPRETVLDSRTDPAALAAQIEALGGLLFFAHTEEDRRWDLPQLTGMEIYNIHTDFLDEDLRALAPDILVSIRAYPDQVLRRVFDPQVEILAKWDNLGRTRNITGIAANDCHQNTGFRGYYTESDTFRLCSTANADVIREFGLNFFTRTLLRLFPGPLEPGRQLFRVDLDPYARSMRFVNTHLLARDLTEPALLEALRTGRAYIAFDMIADARGFVFVAETPGARAVMGESIPAAPEAVLKAEAPLEVRYTLWKDGAPVGDPVVGRRFEVPVETPGKYRLVADLEIRGEWVPWIYTNPITVLPGGGRAG